MSTMTKTQPRTQWTHWSTFSQNFQNISQTLSTFLDNLTPANTFPTSHYKSTTITIRPKTNRLTSRVFYWAIQRSISKADRWKTAKFNSWTHITLLTPKYIPIGKVPAILTRSLLAVSSSIPGMRNYWRELISITFMARVTMERRINRRPVLLRWAQRISVDLELPVAGPGNGPSSQNASTTNPSKTTSALTTKPLTLTLIISQSATRPSTTHMISTKPAAYNSYRLWSASPRSRYIFFQETLMTLFPLLTRWRILKEWDWNLMACRRRSRSESNMWDLWEVTKGKKTWSSLSSKAQVTRQLPTSLKPHTWCSKRSWPQVDIVYIFN